MKSRSGQKRKIEWIHLALIIGPMLGWICAKSVTGFIDDQKLADKPYVDERFVEGKRYTDERSVAVLKEAIQHSDTNMRELNLKMEQVTSEYRISSATMTTKLDALVDAVKDLKDEWHQNESALRQVPKSRRVHE